MHIMSVSPNAAPGPQNPEIVSPDTIHAILTQTDATLTGQQEYETLGRAVEFVETFDGESVHIMVQLQPVEQSSDGSIGGVTVYPDSLHDTGSGTKFALIPADTGMQLKKFLPVDTSDFEFGEEPPEITYPPSPEPNADGIVEYTEEYSEAVAAAKRESGYDAWKRRRDAARARYIAGKRADDGALGLDILYETQAREILRVLHAGELKLRRYRQHEEGRRRSVAGWLAATARHAIDWLKGN